MKDTKSEQEDFILLFENSPNIVTKYINKILKMVRFTSARDEPFIWVDSIIEKEILLVSIIKNVYKIGISNMYYCDDWIRDYGREIHKMGLDYNSRYFDDIILKQNNLSDTQYKKAIKEFKSSYDISSHSPVFIPYDDEWNIYVLKTFFARLFNKKSLLIYNKNHFMFLCECHLS